MSPEAVGPSKTLTAKSTGVGLLPGVQTTKKN